MRASGPNASSGSESGRPDVIDALEQIARKHGQVQFVGPAYYAAFASVTAEEVERLSVLVIMNHEREVRRLSKGAADDDAVDAVSTFVGRALGMIAHGFAMIDGFGSFVITARDGPETTAEEDAALGRALESAKPWIRDAVRRFLPWCLVQGGRPTSFSLEPQI